MNKVKIIKNILQAVKQDMKRFIEFCGVLLLSTYVSSILISGLIVLAQHVSWIRLGVLEVTVPVANYWFWVHLVLAFVYYIYNTCSKAIKNQK